jgi:transglutaminase-like putative cysteine protease
MSLRLLHRRLAVLMSLTGLVAFAGGAGFEPLSAFLALIALGTALFWHPDAGLSDRMEKIWLPLATLLVVRALIHVFVIQDDVVIPVVDLLLLLMAAEALRSLDAPNDIRLYALSFALILASTAYRPGILFLVAFITYVGLSTLALMVGHLRRKAEEHNVREVPLDRGLIITTGVLAGVILLVSLVVFVSVPRVSQGWAGRGETLATSIAGFSDEISLGQFGSTILANPEIVLRVAFPNGEPEQLSDLRWRGLSYDRFDGVRWTRSGRIPPSSAPSAWYRRRWPNETIEQRIFGAPLDVRVLFALHPALHIDSDNGVQALFDNSGDWVYWGSGAPVYTAFSRTSSPPADSLRIERGGYAPSSRFFLQTPNSIDPRIAALADSLTAGIDNRYDKAMAVQRWLQTFTYTRDLPDTAREATLEHFLFDRQAGHCEYFSSAMTIMLRTLGIQARNVNGFLGGDWSQFGDYLVVTQNSAHSWVEVWFPEFGWVTFDPTPAGAGSNEGLNMFWPGRIFFDGLQHRWSKWVLDYNVEDQSGLLAQWANLFGEREDPASASTGEDTRTNPLGALLLVAVLVGGYFWARGGGPPMPPETKAYIALRENCARAGLSITPGLTPLALVARVREERSSAARAAERIVDLYLRSRYGREALSESDLREVHEALGVARKTLKARA